MKNDLSCAVVRDLLPSFTEGLTEPETNEAVERHLDSCPHCRRRCDAMRRDAETVPEAEAKELDYLKAVNRRGRRRTIRAVALTLALIALIAGGMALKLFIIGEPASSAGMSWSIQEDGNYLNVRAFSTWSGVAYCRWETERNGDAIYIRAKKVLPSYLYSTADHRAFFSIDGVKNVYLAETLIWSEGEAINSRVLELMGHKTAYIGNASAVSALGEALGFSDLGAYTIGLRTATEPYEWSVEFTTGDKGLINDHMTVNAMYMLALVDNLEVVSWTSPGSVERKMDVEDADRYLQSFLVEAYENVYKEDLNFPESIKDCATPAGIAKLEKLERYLEAYR